MKKIIVYGAGAYANVFYYEVKRTNIMEIVAFAVDSNYIQAQKDFLGIPLICFENCEVLYPPEEYDMMVLCGYTRMRDRKAMFDKAKAKGYKLCNYISPDAYVEEGVQLGENNIIFSNAFIGHHGKMGDGNIVRQNVYLGHQFNLGNHIIISSGCTIGGNCKIGDMSFIALGAVVIDSISIGYECLIGAASNVVKNIDAFSKCVGNPARVIGNFEETGVVVKPR